MNCNYADIRSRIAEPPTWFDEHSVPRWGEFSPDAVANIYADQVALLRVDCQACGHQFRVAVSETEMQAYVRARSLDENVNLANLKRLADYAREKALAFGDPPNIECCPAGPTMSANERRVIEFWKKHDFDWVRCPELEVRLDEVEP